MYKALYRKWRPLTFDDVISQKYITDTLKNQIISGKTAHAYLFTGSRGTGKTTCARILAKAVNCRNMKYGNPCLECDICRDADNGSLTDIIEIDAASNNGVDDIRDLRDATAYSPERCRYKVYIIDEVHMLSASAFNALLKIMEEPPPYVMFILATTEIQKVPATITSRCQRYDFRRIKSADIAERLKYIASKENIGLTDSGAQLIAKLADGGMRDAVSLLDQCSVCAETIDADTVSATAGIAGRDRLFGILEAVCESDTAKALDITSQLYDMSKDLSQLCEELIVQLRNILLLIVSPQSAENLITAVPEEVQKLTELARKSDSQTVMNRLSELQDCRERMTKVLNKRVEFEMTLIKLCRKITPVANISTQTIDNSEIYDKIKKLEDKLSSISSSANTNPPPIKEKPLTAESPVPETEPKPNVDIKRLKPSDLVPCQQWEEILEEFRKVSPSVAGSLADSHAMTAGNVVFITAVNRYFMELFKIKDNAVLLGATVNRILKGRYVLRARCETTIEEQANMVEMLVKKAKNSGIETAVDNIQ